MSTHTIKLKVNKEEDLYHPLDPDRTVLSGEVRSYVVDRLKERHLGEDIELHILSEEQLDQDAVRNAFRVWAEAEESNIKKENTGNLLRQFLLLAVGIGFIAANLVLQDHLHVVGQTIISTIGAFSVWEASNSWLIRNPVIKSRRIMVNLLKKHIRIVFEDSGSR